MTGIQEQVWDALVSLDSATLLQAITDYHGMQLLDDGFMEFLVDENLMVQPDDDEYEDDDTPQDGDYIMREDRDGVFVGIAGSSPLGVFSGHEEAQAAVTAHMKKHGYYPDVWFESDHGNLSRYVME
jgi:hypothetical protein